MLLLRETVPRAWFMLAKQNLIYNNHQVQLYFMLVAVEFNYLRQASESILEY